MSKSLKNVKNVKQIRNDVFMQISSQPDNTCPLIDELLTMHRARGYRSIISIELTNEPDKYEVDLSLLFKRSEQLEKWSEDIIELYENYKEDNTDKNLDLEYSEETLANIKSFITDNSGVKDILEKYAEKINNIIEEWKESNEAYDSFNKTISDLESTRSEMERAFDDLEDEDEKENLIVEIDEINNQLSEAENSIKELKRDFRTIEFNLDKYCECLDESLEECRNNHENMRKESALLKSYLLENDDSYDLRQPMQYLKELEKGKNNEISLGILNNDPLIISELTKYLVDQELLNSLQKTILDKFKEPEKIINTLKNQGYEKIYYFKSEEDFIRNKNSFVEIDNTKNKQKLKI